MHSQARPSLAQAASRPHTHMSTNTHTHTNTHACTHARTHTRARARQRGRTLSPGCASHSRIMVSSLLMVLPEPVGAPSSTLSSLWYSVWKA
jgi:hypothetical protein